MARKNIYLILIVIILLAVVIGGVYWFKNIPKNNEDESLTHQPNVGIPSDETSQKFIKSVLSDLPTSYLVANIKYLETPDAKEKDAVEVRPCHPAASSDYYGVDPTKSPLCFTIFTLFEDGIAKNLQEYVARDKLLSWYENAVVTTQKNEFIEIKYSENISLLYTPEPFACFGTGDLTCMRKRYIYHFEDDSIVVAEVSFWPYKDGRPFEEALPEVKEVMKVYEEILIGQKNIPAEIKKINRTGDEISLTIDLLTHNPNFNPGVTDFFLNSDSSLVDVKLTNQTKIYTCAAGPDGDDTTADVIGSLQDFIKYVESWFSSEHGRLTYYFYFQGENVMSVYQQCLP